MNALAIDLKGFQTCLGKNNSYVPSNMIFDSATKELKHRKERIVLKTNNTRNVLPLMGIPSNFGTTVIKTEKQSFYYEEWIKTFSTQITGSLDFWSGKATLSDYEMLVDDYDVSEIEEIHMQAAAKYGW